VLLEGVRAARRTLGEGSREVLGLLGLWVDVAVADATPRALDRVLYEICRVNPRDEESAHLEALVRGALGVWMWTERTLANIEAVAPFEDAALARRRRGVCVSAARRSPLEREEAVIPAAEAWARAAGDPASLAARAGWLGRLRYRQARYDDAAAFQAEAAASERACRMARVLLLSLSRGRKAARPSPRRGRRSCDPLRTHGVLPGERLDRGRRRREGGGRGPARLHRVRGRDR
jgi:hypothetical protein